MNPPKHYVVVKYTFQYVPSFNYLGSIVKDQMEEEEEIRNCIKGAKKSYFALRSFLRNKLLN